MLANPALEKLLAEKFDTPDFDRVARVYADWLLEHDAPAGEFILRQLTLERILSDHRLEPVNELLLLAYHPERPPQPTPAQAPFIRSLSVEEQAEVPQGTSRGARRCDDCAVRPSMGTQIGSASAGIRRARDEVDGEASAARRLLSTAILVGCGRLPRDGDAEICASELGKP